MRALSGGGVQHAFECIGLAVTAEQAFAMLDRGGCATIVGMIPLGQSVQIPGVSLLHERKLQGSMLGSLNFRISMPRYVDYYLQGQLNLDDMITKRNKLEEVNEAFRAMRAGEVTRSVLMLE